VLKFAMAVADQVSKDATSVLNMQPKMNTGSVYAIGSGREVHVTYLCIKEVATQFARMA